MTLLSPFLDSDMDILMKAAAVCVAAAVISAAIKKASPSLAMLLSIGAGCVTLAAALSAAREISDFLREVAQISGIEPAVLSVVMKTVGIALVTRLASDVCRDAGMSSASSATEFVGAVSALYVAIPVMRTVLQMIKGLL